MEAGVELQLFAIMDGHGEQGEKISNYLKVHLPLSLVEESSLKDLNIAKVIL
jgi:hypothetical protein